MPADPACNRKAGGGGSDLQASYSALSTRRSSSRICTVQTRWNLVGALAVSREPSHSSLAVCSTPSTGVTCA